MLLVGPQILPFFPFLLIQTCYMDAVMASSANADFITWGTDKTAHGPVDLPTLVSWVRNKSVTADTWVFVPRIGVWERASQVPELQLFFGAKSQPADAAGAALGTVTGVDPRSLRRLKILAGLNDHQLERFARFIEVMQVPQWSTIVKQGDRGDAMYLVLEGELRVSMKIGSEETMLATLGQGDFFGDISLFDHGPRSANVLADRGSVLLKISSAALAEMVKQAPDLATPFLLAIGRTLTARIRAGNKHHGEAVRFAQMTQ
jgi:CRP/FNR family cyclic AMP-dependent transcriptional regulator